MRKWRQQVAAVLLALLATAPVGRAAIEYSITDLGALGGDSFSYGINAKGQVTGWTGSGSFLYSDGRMTGIGSLGGTTWAYAINNDAHVVGASQTGHGLDYHAFVYSDGTIKDVGTFGGPYSMARGINDRGQIVGYATDPTLTAIPFLYDGSNMSRLPTLGGVNAYPAAINAAGHIAGESEVPQLMPNGRPASHAFFYDGAIHDLGTLGGLVSDAWGMNDQDDVVGFSNTADPAVSHAFLYSHGTMHDLGALGGTFSQAFGVNNQSVVVGYSFSSPNTVAAFVYRDGAMIDLNTLIDPNSGWSLAQANAIYDAGQIAGWGYGPNGTHAFLLTPIPEPVAVTWAAAGVVLLQRPRDRCRSHWSDASD